MGIFKERAATRDPDDTIASFYRAVLGREPEPGAIEYWRPDFESKGFEFVLGEFVKSEELRMRIAQTIDRFPFDRAPAQMIETSVDPVTMNNLWSRVSQTWTKLGNDAMPKLKRAPAKRGAVRSQRGVDIAMSDPAYALGVQIVEALEAMRDADASGAADPTAAALAEAQHDRARRVTAALAVTPAQSRSGLIAHIVTLQREAQLLAAVLPLVDLTEGFGERVRLIEQFGERIQEALDADVV